METYYFHVTKLNICTRNKFCIRTFFHKSATVIAPNYKYKANHSTMAPYLPWLTHIYRHV